MDSFASTLLESSSGTSEFLDTTSNSILAGASTIAEAAKTSIPEKYQIIVLSFAYGIISLLSLIGNSSIIYIVVRNRRMHSVTNYFICNLALADCLVACFAVPFQFQAAVLQVWILPHFLCKLAPFVQILSVDVSIYTLVAVSLDRYHVMLHPLKPKLSTKPALLIFLIVWLIALASSTPSLYLYNVYLIDDYGFQCLPYRYQKQQLPSNSTKSYDVHKIYTVYNIYSQYVIPFIIISCAYFRIGSHLYFSKPVGQTKHQEVIARNKRKVLKMLFTVVALFLTCWFPLQLYNFLHVYKPEINDFQHIAVLWLCANWLAMSNSCHNPFIYGFCSARFKREFRQLYSCLPGMESIRVEGDVSEASRAKAFLPSKPPVRRTLGQRPSPPSSMQPCSHQTTGNTSVNDVPMNSPRSSAPARHHDGDNGKLSDDLVSNRHQRHSISGNHHSSQRSLTRGNYDKFVPEQDANGLSRENDLLLIHGRQQSLYPT